MIRRKYWKPIAFGACLFCSGIFTCHIISYWNYKNVGKINTLIEMDLNDLAYETYAEWKRTGSWPLSLSNLPSSARFDESMKNYGMSNSYYKPVLVHTDNKAIVIVIAKEDVRKEQGLNDAYIMIRSNDCYAFIIGRSVTATKAR